MIKLYDSSGRIESIDIMKGIGILLMLLSHSIAYKSALKTWVFSFHMPLFLWCTGYLIAVKSPAGSALKGKLKTLIARKTLSVLVPYVIFSVLIATYFFFLTLLHSHTFDMAPFMDRLRSIVALRGVESLWFLPCMLIAEILFFTLYAHLPVGGLGAMCVASLMLSVVFNNSLPEGILGAFVRSTAGFVFICLGYLTAILRRMRAENGLRMTLPLYADLLLIAIGAMLSHMNGFAAIGSYELGFVPFFYISAAMTLQGCFDLCSRVSALQLIPFFGKNSIVILCTNNVVIEILRLLDSKLGGGFFLSHGTLGNVLFAALLATIEIPIIIIGMKYFRCFFGELPKNIVSGYGKI